MMSFCNLNPRNYSLFACCHRVYKNAISTCRLIRLSTSHNYVCCVVVVVSMPLLGWQAILAGIMFSTCPFHPSFVRPSVRSSVTKLKHDTCILTSVDSSGSWGKGTKQSTLRVRRSKEVKVTWGFWRDISRTVWRIIIKPGRQIVR